MSRLLEQVLEGHPKMEFSKRKTTKDQCREAGMASVLLLLILSVATARKGLVVVATTLQVATMIGPQLFRPVAVFLHGLSEYLGTIVATVVLSILFFVFVTPFGVLRRAIGKDTLRLRSFKAGEDSVMLERNHRFAPADLERPY